MLVFGFLLLVQVKKSSSATSSSQVHIYQALSDFKSEPSHVTFSPKSTYWQTQKYISTVLDAFVQAAKADYSLCEHTNPSVVTLSI